MAKKLGQRFDAHVNLIASDGGVFEVNCKGKLIFSKKECGRFPNDEEVENLIAKSNFTEF